MGRSVVVSLLMLTGCATPHYIGDYDRERFWRYALKQDAELPQAGEQPAFGCGDSWLTLSAALSQARHSLRLKVQEEGDFRVHGDDSVVTNLLDVRHVNSIYKVTLQTETHDVALVLYIEPWNSFGYGSTHGVAVVISPCRAEVLDAFVWMAEDTQ